MDDELMTPEQLFLSLGAALTQVVSVCFAMAEAANHEPEAVRAEHVWEVADHLVAALTDARHEWDARTGASTLMLVDGGDA